MGALILPSRFNQQPQQAAQIDRSNPIASGIVFAVMPGLASLNIANQASLGGTSGVPAIGRSGVGAIASSPTSVSTVSAVLGASYTLFAFGEITTVGAQGSPIDDDDGTTRGFLFRINATGGPDFIPFTAGNTPLVLSGTDFTAAQLASGVAIAGTVDSAGNAAVWGNGQKTTGLLGAAPRAPSSTIALLNRKVGGTQIPTTRPVYLCVGWNRVLTDVELISLSANPWQLFKAPPRRLWGVSSSGTDTPVNPAVGTVVLTGYAPTIIQPQAVAPGAGSLSITGYAPTVSQAAGQNVTPAAGMLSLSGFAPAVTQTGNQTVLPAAGPLAVTGYAPTITQASPSPNVAPSAGSIVIAGYEPTVIQSGGAGRPRRKFQVETSRGIVEVDTLSEVVEVARAEKRTPKAKNIEVKLAGIKVPTPSLKPNLDYRAIEDRMRAQVQAEIDDEEELLLMML